MLPAPQHPQTPPIGILIELTQSIQISVYTIVLAVTQYHSYIVIDYFYSVLFRRFQPLRGCFLTPNFYCQM